jgi:hypothetical protein
MDEDDARIAGQLFMLLTNVHPFGENRYGWEAINIDHGAVSVDTADGSTYDIIVRKRSKT